ncbi:AzlC family ABC transporter permease [Treponema sp. UBA3813]|uniref:AzlC family ABC transporter permease n=1 Tax=Treponema sp. UBA3813 TaxID=1947715 RepID=UPI0025E2CC21|nr:AzlC family ABC transporter permease [Treponema sp. UBA3813]
MSEPENSGGELILLMNNKSAFLNGLAAGIPIGLGYFAVSFSLGIVARKAGLNPVQGFVASWFNLASAGEYALFTAIEQLVTYFEVALITFVVNARYLLMSCALSQRISPETPFFHRFFVAFGITDEIFGVSIAQTGALNPFYNYGAMAVAVPLWSIGTSLGIIAGNMLPVMVVNALSVALYGMFIAIIIPPAKKNMTIAAAVAVSFALSWGFSILPFVRELSSGNRTIILTVAISAVLAYLKPVEEEEK